MPTCCDRTVQIMQPSFAGAYTHIAHLDQRRYQHAKLRRMIVSGQLLLNADGTLCARWVTNPDGSVSVIIGDRLYPQCFLAKSAQFISFQQDVIISGTLVDGTTGIFSLSSEGLRQLTANQPIIIQKGAVDTVVFTHDPDDPEDIHRLFGHSFPGGYPVNKDACVTPVLQQGLLVAEPVQHGWYRYFVSTQGFADFYPVPHKPDAVCMGVAKWMNRVVLIWKKNNSFSLELLGESDLLESERTIPIEGELEYVWQAPKHGGLAWLTRVQEKQKMIRRLFVNNELFYEGEFIIHPNGLTWSLFEQSAAVYIHTGENGIGPSLLVSEEGSYEIESDRVVDEFVLDATGEIVAWIENDGKACYPVVYGAPHDGVELAWNLHCEVGGTVRYNCVVSDVVLLIQDKTHVQKGSTD